jgi:hypothetical protein
MLILFVLSHGESNGVIWTDTKSGNPTAQFETFTTVQVLAKLANWEQCLKLIFFAVRYNTKLLKYRLT